MNMNAGLESGIRSRSLACRKNGGIIVLSPGKLKKAFKIVEEENWMLRAFLKGQDSDEVDRVVNNLHMELFDGFDCVACSNCCYYCAHS